MCRVTIKNDMVYSCSTDGKVKAWSITNLQKKYEYKYEYSCTQSTKVFDIVIGRQGTPLENRIVALSQIGCRILNLDTGVEVKKITLDGSCWSITADKAQTVIAIGTDKNVTFFETTNFTKVKEVPLKYVYSLAFNERNDCMLAVTSGAEVYSFKF